MIEVLCCCNPSNSMGFLPKGCPFPLHEWEDEDGNTGFAYSSEDIPLSLSGGKKGKKKKTWKK